MLNLLIANKNLQNLQDLQNYISLYVPEIRVGYIAKDGKNALDILNQYPFDLILLESKLPEMDGFQILENLSNIKKIEYEKSIIFLSNNKFIVDNFKNHPLIFDTFYENESFSKIISSLKQLAESKKNQSEASLVKNKIFNELQNIGYNLAHNGTHYIAESLVLISTYNYNYENLTRTIYPKVSKTYHKNVHNIKCNITSATDAACKNLSPAMQKKYLKISDNIKPTTKMIINYILRRL